MPFLINRIVRYSCNSLKGSYPCYHRNLSADRNIVCLKPKSLHGKASLMNKYKLPVSIYVIVI